MYVHAPPRRHQAANDAPRRREKARRVDDERLPDQIGIVVRARMGERPTRSDARRARWPGGEADLTRSSGASLADPLADSPVQLE